MRRPIKGFVGFFRAVWETVADPQFLELSVIAVGMIMLGTIFYSNVEGWRVIDSLYFSVITLTTVGYGDLTPQTDAGKLFTIFYILIGVGILLGFVTSVATHTRNKSPLDKLFERK